MYVHNQCNSVLVWSEKDERYKAGIAVVRAIKWHNIIVEFTASSGVPVSDNMIQDYCNSMVFTL